MPADHQGAQNAQVMQVVTGACLLIRPEVFAQVGGFDERYWNGNEDVDLCLKVREQGWDVVYRGESVVYHYESQSGPERFRQIEHNVKLFNEIWEGRVKPDYHPRSGRPLPGDPGQPDPALCGAATAVPQSAPGRRGRGPGGGGRRAPRVDHRPDLQRAGAHPALRGLAAGAHRRAPRTGLRGQRFDRRHRGLAGRTGPQPAAGAGRAQRRRIWASPPATTSAWRPRAATTCCC